MQEVADWEREIDEQDRQVDALLVPRTRQPGADAAHRGTRMEHPVHERLRNPERAYVAAEDAPEDKRDGDPRDPHGPHDCQPLHLAASVFNLSIQASISAIAHGMSID